MGKKAEITEVTKYRVSPPYVDGKKPPKVVKVKCLQKGKTTFFPSRAKVYIRVSELYDTPREALEAFIKDAREEDASEAKWVTARNVFVKECQRLLEEL